ncbi:MAG: sensor histidine kinase N-terminal domain-containing protein [Thiobacillaceae bacterium]
MTLSLHNQLLRRMLWPLLLVSLAGGIIAYFLALLFSEDAYDQSLVDNARSLAREIDYSQGHVHLNLSAQATDMLQWDPQDRVYFRVDSARDGFILGQTGLTQAILDGKDEAFAYGTYSGHKVRLVTIAELFGDQIVKVTVAETLNKRTRLASEVLVTVIVLELLVIVLALLLIRSGVRRGLAPISELEQEAHLRSFTDLTPLPETSVPDEIRPFTNAINNLLGRLGKTMDAQNRLIADAAHQLRTPLAAIKVHIERALREPKPAGHAEALQQALAALERTSRLTNQLLLMARAESDAESPRHHATIDLCQSAMDTGSLWVPKALSQGADLGFEGPDEKVPVKGDPLLLAEMVNNLLDNALRYAGPKPRITLRIEPRRADHGPILSVEDNGPAIPEHERETIFERFHRISGSTGEGSGLGLAIVREIANAHGATVVLENPPQGGNRFSVYFPNVNDGKF